MATSTFIVDSALIYILAVSALLFFLIIFFMIYFLVRYRKTRNPIPSELPDSRLIEIVWVVIPTLIVITMFLYGLTGFNFLRKMPENSLTVKVHARQWAWIFEYDNGKKSPDLIVPVGKNITCEITTDDVIHGFYIPAYRIQIDTVPNITTKVWFNATTVGTHDILCAQYCGEKHSAMMSKLIVVPNDQFIAWMQGKDIRGTASSLYSGMPSGQKLLFERGCISCHSLEGVPMAGPTFKGLFGSQRDVVSAGKIRTVLVDEKYIVDSILTPGSDVATGFPNIMPSGRAVLADKEIEDIVKFIKTLQ